MKTMPINCSFFLGNFGCFRRISAVQIAGTVNQKSLSSLTSPNKLTIRRPLTLRRRLAHHARGAGGGGYAEEFTIYHPEE